MTNSRSIRFSLLSAWLQQCVKLSYTQQKKTLGSELFTPFIVLLYCQHTHTVGWCIKSQLSSREWWYSSIEGNSIFSLHCVCVSLFHSKWEENERLRHTSCVIHTSTWGVRVNIVMAMMMMMVNEIICSCNARWDFMIVMGLYWKYHCSHDDCDDENI